MSKELRGKYLVRKGKVKGKDVVVITGVFYPNFDIDDINDDDEMWVSDITVEDGGLRFTDPNGVDGGSPEDFLDGENQSPKYWKNKSKLS